MHLFSLPMTMTLAGLFTVGLTGPSYETAVPRSANVIVQAGKGNLLKMPLAIVYLWEDELPAEEGPVPAHRAHELARLTYPDANPEVFVKTVEPEAYTLVLWQWIDERSGRKLPPEERLQLMAELEAAVNN
jgi:hypothetical protein